MLHFMKSGRCWGVVLSRLVAFVAGGWRVVLCAPSNSRESARSFSFLSWVRFASFSWEGQTNILTSRPVLYRNQSENSYPTHSAINFSATGKMKSRVELNHCHISERSWSAGKECRQQMGRKIDWPTGFGKSTLIQSKDWITLRAIHIVVRAV